MYAPIPVRKTVEVEVKNKNGTVGRAGSHRVGTSPKVVLPVSVPCWSSKTPYIVRVGRI